MSVALAQDQSEGRATSAGDSPLAHDSLSSRCVMVKLATASVELAFKSSSLHSVEMSFKLRQRKGMNLQTDNEKTNDWLKL